MDKLSSEELQVLKATKDIPAIQIILKMVQRMVDDLSDLRKVPEEKVSKEYIIGRQLAAKLINDELIEFITRLGIDKQNNTETEEESFI